MVRAGCPQEVCFQARQGAESIWAPTYIIGRVGGTWRLHLSAQREAKGARAEVGEVAGQGPGESGAGLVAGTPPGLANGTSCASTPDTTSHLSC